MTPEDSTVTTNPGSGVRRPSGPGGRGLHGRRVDIAVEHLDHLRESIKRTNGRAADLGELERQVIHIYYCVQGLR